MDETSLGLVIREALDNGRKALQILREHYAGRGKPRIISLYTQLTSLIKGNSETVTEYMIRAETAVTALKNAGEIVSDGLLIAMVMKGLPKYFKSFIVVITQTTEKMLTFQKFKVALRCYEENDKATSSQSNKELTSAVMQMNFNSNENQDRKKSITCYSCGLPGHRSFECRKEKRWCNLCKTSSHTDKACRRKQDNSNWRDSAKIIRDNFESDEEDTTFAFLASESEENHSINDNSLLVDCGATTHN